MINKNNISNYKNGILNQLKRFEDIKFTGQLIFIIIVILIFWSGAKAVQSNYNLQKQITSTIEQNNNIKLQNNAIKLQNEYYKSNQFIELQARQNLGLAYPGETELIVPNNVALKYIVNLKNQNNRKTKINTGLNNNNFSKWIDFFFHKT